MKMNECVFGLNNIKKGVRTVRYEESTAIAVPLRRQVDLLKKRGYNSCSPR